MLTRERRILHVHNSRGLQALKNWMDFHASYGEKISGESWVMRNILQTADVKRKAEEAALPLTHPQELPSTAIKKYKAVLYRIKASVHMLYHKGCGDTSRKELKNIENPTKAGQDR